MQRAAGMVILEVPAHHPPGIFPPGQAKLHDFHARYYSKDRAADLLLRLSLVFGLWSGSKTFSVRQTFIKNLGSAALTWERRLTLTYNSTALSPSLSHITSRTYCLLVPFLTSPWELVALSFLARQTGTPENYMASATEGEELSDCQKFWKNLARQTTPILFLVCAPKHMNSRVFWKKKCFPYFFTSNKIMSLLNQLNNFG